MSMRLSGSGQLRNVTGLLLVLTFVIAAGRCCSTVRAEDWPWFLGPRHTGESAETDLVLDWTAGAPPVLWKQPIGTGYSAPSVLGDRLVVHHRKGNQEIISCRRRSSGEEIWQYAYESAFEDPYGYNNGPRCSPVLTPKFCFTLGAEGMLCCLSLEDGSVVWKNDLKTSYQLPEWFFGMGCSPLLEQGRQASVWGSATPERQPPARPPRQ